MKSNVVVTIGRAFGSEGREIGEKLARKLGMSFYDKNLILMAAKKSGIDPELLESADEKLINRFMDPYAAAISVQGSTNDRLFQAQSEIIREVAGKESCVIVGRLADHVLQHHPSCLKVFIYAPYEERVKKISRKHKLSEGDAKRLVKQMDKIRKNYYAYFTDGTWDQKEGKHLLIDSSFLGIEGTVSLIEKAIEIKFN